MLKFMSIIFLSVGFSLLMFTVQVFGAQDTYEFDNPQMRQSYKVLTETLRCPKCQNQNIADSEAMIAHDMKRKVFELVSQGKSEDDVIEYMTSRYGNFVSYRPPVTFATSLLWFLPIAFVLFGGMFFLFYGKLSSQKTLSAKDKRNEEQVLEQANKMLGQD